MTLFLNYLFLSAFILSIITAVYLGLKIVKLI